MPRWRWLIAFLFALTVHASVLLLLPQFSLTAGAKDEGDSGFDVGLGLAQIPSVAAPQTVTPPPVTPEPEAPPPEPVVEEIKPASLPKPEPVTQPEPQVLDTQIEREPTESRIDQVDPALTQGDSFVSEEVPVGLGTTRSYGGTPGVQNLYITKLAARLNRFKYYPMKSLRNGEEGIVQLALVLNRNGKVLELAIAEGSGFETLDATALKIVQRAKPLPRFDRRMEQDKLRVRIPIEFGISPRR